MNLRLPLISLGLLASLLMNACGGGGGGGAGGTAAPSNAVPIGPSISVSGRITYERVGSNANGSLDYNNITNQPARGVTVQLYANNIFVAETSADANGSYVFSNAPGNNSLVVRAFSEVKKTTGTSQWDFAVADNTQSGAVYALTSAQVGAATAPIVINLSAASGWSNATRSYSSARQAAPFAIADTFYTNLQKVLTVAPNTIFPTLTAYWSVNNTTARGNIELGQIGVSFFQPSGSLGGNISRRDMFILGAANTDTDEYDESVLAHEWGHYYQSAFSRDDSPGGAHGGSDDRLDRRLAFSEGWGTAWSGIALNNSVYKDSFASSQAQGFTINMSNGFSSHPLKGWFREKSMTYILWALNQQVGFAPIHAALTSSAFKAGVATPDIYSFAAAYRSLNPSSANALNTLMAAENVNTTSDAFGNQETNTGGSTVALPFYRSVGSSLCASSQFDPSNVGNKIGRYVYVRFTTASTGLRFINVSSTAGVDPDFEIYSRGVIMSQAFAEGTSETSSVTLTAGEHLLMITDYNNTAAPCFTVTVN
jgi:hypothetical protein